VAKQKVNRGSSHWVMLLGAVAVLSGQLRGARAGIDLAGDRIERG
jgi:hypothetical protein